MNEQYEVLQRGIAIHKRLERLVLEESGLDEVVRALAAAIGGAIAGIWQGRSDRYSELRTNNTDGLSDYRIHPTEAVNFVRSNARPASSRLRPRLSMILAT